jgi:RNA recognition motif-containing protein
MSWRRSRGINAMATRLLVRNLSFDTTRASLVDLFSAVGGMLELSMPQDRETGQTRGLAYVAMATDADAQAAIDKLNGRMLDGRPLRISLAPARPPFADLRRDPN